LGLDYFQVDQMGPHFLAALDTLAQEAIAIGGEAELLRVAEFRDYFSKLDEQTRVSHFCGAGINLFAQDARQNLYLCPSMVGHSRAKLGSNGKVTHSAALEQLDRAKGSLIEANQCTSCWARFICGGGCMFVHETSTGEKHRKSQGFCFVKRGSLKIALAAYEQLRREQQVS
jgi:uncharacterized protein